MRLVIRHLSPLIRSRRRIPFVLTIGILVSIGCILYFIDYDKDSENFINTSVQQIKSANNQTISIRTKTSAQK
jgi:hypothetical protein